MTSDRLARVRNAVAEASQGPDLDLTGVGLACVALVGVDGSGVILMDNRGEIREVVSVSDKTIERIEDVQFTQGEGPCIDAFTRGSPVLEPDLVHTSTTRWVNFVADALAAGVGAVFCLPLQVGAIRIGSLNLYRARTGSLSDDELADALVLADVATEIVLDIRSQVPPGSLIGQMAEAGPYGARVHQATGMVSGQANIGVKAALSRLRAHAFATDLSLATVAADVVDGRLRFD
jgi:hypothetical protein